MKLNELVNSIIFKVSGLSNFRDAVRQVDELEDKSRDAADGVEELEDEMTKAYRAGEFLGKSIRRVGGGLKRLAGGILGVIPKALGVSSLSFTALGAAAIAAASDTQEAQSKMRDILGVSASDLENWSRRNAASFNASTNELRTFATDFAVQFKTLGESDQETIRRSQEFTSRALDLASFSNKSAADVAADFTSALNGSSETVEKYGVNLKEAALTQFILTSGLAKSKKEITENDKRLARYELILRGTSASAGNAARTSGDFANVLRNLRGRFVDLLTDVGIRLIPLATRALQGLTRLVTENQDEIVAFFERGAAAVQRFIEEGGLQRIAELFGNIAEFALGAAGAVDKFLNISQGERDIESVQETLQAQRNARANTQGVGGQVAGTIANIRAAITGSDRTAAENIVNNRRGGFERPPLNDNQIAGGNSTVLTLNQDIRVEANNNDTAGVESAVRSGANSGIRSYQRVSGASGVNY